jgi:branched-chain amino acid transport system ATP-binding protein
MQLEIKNLHVSYGKIRALHSIDFSIDKGEIVCIIGANGAGKSTTLRAISRLIPADKGSAMTFEGKNLLQYPPDKVGRIARDVERVFTVFPRLMERKSQMAGTLSGGEQAPLLMLSMFEALKEINSEGTTILLVEQNARLALKFAQRAYVLENGRLVLQGLSGELLNNPEVKKAYLGG